MKLLESHVAAFSPEDLQVGSSPGHEPPLVLRPSRKWWVSCPLLLNTGSLSPRSCIWEGEWDHFQTVHQSDL